MTREDMEINLRQLAKLSDHANFVYDKDYFRETPVEEIVSTCKDIIKNSETIINYFEGEK